MGRHQQLSCDRGHPLEGDNVIIVKRKNKKPDRACRICANERKREWWRKNHGKR